MASTSSSQEEKEEKRRHRKPAEILQGGVFLFCEEWALVFQKKKDVDPKKWTCVQSSVRPIVKYNAAPR